MSQAAVHDHNPQFVPLSSEELYRLQARGASWVRGLAISSRPTLRLYRRPRTRIEPIEADVQLLRAFQGVTPKLREGRAARPSVHRLHEGGSAASPHFYPAPTIPDSLRMSAVESIAVDFGPRTVGRRAFQGEPGTRICALPEQLELTGEGFSLWYRVSPLLLEGRTSSPLATLGGQAVLGLVCLKFTHAGSEADRAAEQLVELTPVVLVQTGAGRALEPLARVVDDRTRNELLKRLAWQQPRELASLALDGTGHSFRLTSLQGSGKEILDIQVGEASWLARLSGAALHRPLLSMLEQGLPVGGQVHKLRTWDAAQVQVGHLVSCVMHERLHRGLIPEGAQPMLVLLFSRLQVQVGLGRTV